MAESAPITSQAVSAAGGAVGTWNLPVNAALITVFNRNANEAWITVGPVGTTPAAAPGAANQWYLPGVVGASTVIPVTQFADQGEQPEVQTVFTAAAAAALSIWVEISQ